MVRVQRNFRAEDFHGASKPEPAPKDEPKVKDETDSTLLSVPVQEETAQPEPKKAPTKRTPKSTKPKAEVDPHVNDATEHKE